MAGKLRAVVEGEVPPRPKTLDEAIENGTYLEFLEAQRRSIAADLPGEKGPSLAALHRQLTLISKEIEALRVKESEEGVDAERTPDEDWDQTAI